MHTFADKPMTSENATAAKSVPPRPHLGQSHAVDSVLRLQRAVGNQAVLRLMARVARRPLDAGEPVHTRRQFIARQRAEGQEEDRPFVQASSVSPGRALQRTATFAAGAVHQANSLADVFLIGTPVGFTPPMLNGAIVMSTTDTRAALVRPTLTVSAAAGGGFDAAVDTVPTNTGSFDETVLARGPWRATVLRTVVGARYPTLTACTGVGTSNFRAIGRPSDAHMFAANRRHENHHAADHKRAFNGSIRRWDRLLTRAHSAGTTFNGASAADAEAALHAAMGGTPDDVADAYFNEAVRLNNVFHATAAGGPVTEENPRSNADCSTSSVRSHNPS